MMHEYGKKCTDMIGFHMLLNINLWLKLVISNLRNQIKIKVSTYVTCLAHSETHK